jgi:hypothetical protein
MRATLQAAMPYDLHGVRHYQVIFLPEGADQPRQARLSHDMLYPDPQPGDTVEVHALLGIVDRITRLES